MFSDVLDGLVVPDQRGDRRLHTALYYKGKPWARAASPSTCKEAETYRDIAVKGQIPVRVSPTVLTEFYTVVTDSRQVRNPLSLEQAWKEVEAYRRALKVLYPSSGGTGSARGADRQIQGRAPGGL